MKDTTVKLEELSDFGTITERWNPNNPLYDFRKLLSFCDAHGVDPVDLTDEERDQFRIN